MTMIRIGPEPTRQKIKDKGIRFSDAFALT